MHGSVIVMRLFTTAAGDVAVECQKCFLPSKIMSQKSKLQRIIVTLGIVRLTYGSPELHFKAPGTVKIQIGQSLMSYEEINVRIFK